MHTQEQALLDLLRLRPSGVPIYVQLRDQILRAIGGGTLGPGDQMPTMRQVAVALKVDLNTVRRAYDELERAGAIRLHRGRGSFVAETPPALDPKVLNDRTDDLAKRLLAMAAAEGVNARTLADRIYALTSKGGESHE